MSRKLNIPAQIDARNALIKQLQDQKAYIEQKIGDLAGEIIVLVGKLDEEREEE